jgi:hypothetical protein
LYEKWILGRIRVIMSTNIGYKLPYLKISNLTTPHP